MKKTLLFAVSSARFNALFSTVDLQRIREAVDVVDAAAPDQPDLSFLMRHIMDADIVVTSWGTARIDSTVIDCAPRLRLMCHAAGSVKPYVSDALWSAGVRVSSAAVAIAPGVAEFCLGLILTASKRVPWVADHVRQGGWSEGLKVFGGPSEIFRQKIGVIGAGYVGRILIGLLQHFPCDVYLYDPYCSAEMATQLGAQKIGLLDEIFSLCDVVSLNAPVTEETRGMLRGSHFALLREGALFINTARGVLINEPEFIEALRTGRFVACLDVTDPVEPPPPDHPFRQLPNVLLTPHIAGAVAQNLWRIGACVADEVEAFVSGNPLRFEVKHDLLDRMA